MAAQRGIEPLLTILEIAVLAIETIELQIYDTEDKVVILGISPIVLKSIIPLIMINCEKGGRKQSN